MATIFQKKFKMSKKNPPDVVENSIICLHFQLHANPTNGFETRILKKNVLSISTINQIGPGETNYRFRKPRVNSNRDIKPEVWRGAVAWYANQSNTPVNFPRAGDM